MIVNSDTLAAIRTDFQAIFLESYAGFVARWPDAATEFPSTTESLDLSWIGEVPSMKEWLDERVIEGLRRYRYAITNKNWEATIRVDRNAIEDDTLGVYRPRIQGLGQEAKRHPEEIISDLLINGDDTTLGLAFDAAAFFANTRSVGDSGNIDNLLAGTGVTQAQFQADYIAAKVALAGYKNDRGKPMNPVLNKLLCVVPPALEFVAKQTFNATIISQTQNILVGEADVWANPYVGADDANDWYLLNIGGPIKPLAISMRRRPGFDALDDPRSEHVFKNRSFLYGTDGRYVGGYLLPWMAAKTINS